jgi:soluble lytic murein transglycosylase-like protein
MPAADVRARIMTEAVRQRVDPALALAVAQQESSFNPNAIGDNGNSLGLFQLQEGAARDAGIDPTRRQDPNLNIPGGINYLRQKLMQAKGDVSQALRLYNGGGDPHYVQHVMRYYDQHAAALPDVPVHRALMARTQAGLAPASPSRPQLVRQSRAS